LRHKPEAIASGFFIVQQPDNHFDHSPLPASASVFGAGDFACRNAQLALLGEVA
jgi:hypothetical protein